MNTKNANTIPLDHEAKSPPQSRSKSPDTTLRNPFVGLRPFDQNDRDYFFGRDEQVKRLLQQLYQARFLAVVGRSGSGKSSLVRAGFIPNLEEGFLIEGRNRWKIATMKPGESPMHTLANELFVAVNGQQSLEQIYMFSRDIRQRGLEAILAKISQPIKNENANMLLIVDQFEELFHFRRGEEGDIQDKLKEATDFVALLLQLATQSSVPFFICLTIRSEFLGDCDAFNGLPEAINHNHLLLPRLTRNQRLEAITCPIYISGANLTLRLANCLVNESIEMRDDLPALQSALTQTWATWKKKGAGPGPLDLQHYEAGNTVKESLNHHADRVLKALKRPGQRIAKRLFQSLTECDSSNRWVRRPRHLSEIVAMTGAEQGDLLRVIHSFRNADLHFLLLSSEDPNEVPFVTLSHESLIWQWHTLSAWVEEDVESAKVYLKLAKASEGQELEHGKWYCGSALQLALEWRKNEQPNSAWAKRYKPDFKKVMRFLDQSRDEEKKWHKTKKRKQQQKQMVLTVVTLFSLALAGISGLFSVTQKEEAKLARESEKRAHQQAGTAIKAEQVAENQAVLARKAEQEAKDQVSIAIKAEQAAKNQAVLARKAEQEAKDQVSIAIKAEQAAKNQAVLARKAEQEAKDQADLAKKEGNAAKDQALNANYSLAKVFEEKALAGLEQAKRTQKKSDYQEAILYASLALAQEIPTDRQALATPSIGGLFASEIFQAAFSEKQPFSQISEPLNTFHGHTRGVLSVAYSPEGTSAASGSEDQSIRIWAVPSGKKLRILNGHTGSVHSVAFSPDGKYIVSGSSDQSLRLWDVASGKTLRRFSGHTALVHTVTFSPDGKILASGSFDQSIRLWDLTSGEVLQTLKAHTRGVRSVVFSPDGKMLASGSFDQSILVWDLSSGKVIRTLEGHTGGVHSLAFSPDGKVLASGSSDHSIRLWNVTTGKSLHTLNGHTDWVQGVVFSPDGKRVASSSFDQSIRIWDVATGQALHTLEGHTVSVQSVAYSPDGKTILSGSFDQTIRLWDVSLYALFLQNGKATPLYKTFMAGSRFVWQVEQGGLKLEKKSPPTLVDQEGNHISFDKKYRSLLLPPSRGENKFDQIFEWSKIQQQNKKT